MTDLAPFERFISPEPMSGCWLWEGGTTGDYGYIHIKGEPLLLAHRAFYERHRGPIAEGLELDHLCRVRCCVNPDHLEPVTRRENILRGMSMPAINARKFACVRGHPLSGDNLRVRRDGTRQCRACHRERGRALSRGEQADKLREAKKLRMRKYRAILRGTKEGAE